MSTQADTDSQPKTILLVEDEAIIALREASLLKTHGYEVVTVYSGEEAVETAAALPAVDMILMDINLGPGMDGTQAAEIILQQRDVPLVFLSSYVDPEVVVKTEGLSSYGYIVKTSGDTVLLASVRMAFRLSEARQLEREKDAALRESEKRFFSAFAYAPVGMAIVAPDGRWLKVNRALCTMLGYTEDELLAKSIPQITFPEDLNVDLEPAQAMLRGEVDTVQLQKRFLHQCGQLVWVQLSFSLVRDKHGAPLHFILHLVDITERKRMDEALQESEQRYRRLVEGMPGIVYTFSDRHGGVYFSPRTEKVLGYPVEYLYEHPFLWNEAIHPDDFGTVMEADRQLRLGKPYDMMYRIRDRRGQWRWLLDRSIACRTEAGEVLIEGLATDITVQKQMEQDKEALFKELQHRAKNSFTLIGSMIELMENAGHSDEARSALADLRVRIKAMSELYQLLSATDAVTQIHLDEYCARVVSSLRISGRIRFQQIYVPVSAPVDIAAPVGLILTELITNALKHAFPDGRGGSISVTLRQPHAGFAVLEVVDDGAGLPASFNLERCDSLGLTLVNVLTAQINGIFQVGGRTESGGTRCWVEFPIR